MEENLKRVVWQFGADKASGPDGFLILFYKKFWEVVKYNLCALVEELANGTTSLDKINYSPVVLLPKK